MISFCAMPSSIAARVAPGRQSIAARRSRTACFRRRDIGFAAVLGADGAGYPSASAGSTGILLAKGKLHEARVARRLLGPRPDRAGPALPGAGGRAPRLRLGLVRR